MRGLFTRHSSLVTRHASRITHHSTLTFACLITLPQRAISALRNSVASFGVLPTGSLPPLANTSITSFVLSPLAVSAWILAMMAGGVLLGMMIMYHEVAS